jgi:hypothetical protein
MTRDEIRKLYSKVCEIEEAETQLEQLINSKDLVIRIYKYEGKFPIISIDTDGSIKREAEIGEKIKKSVIEYLQTIINQKL